MTNEVQEFHVVHDVLYGIAAAVGEVDAEGLLEESAVLVGKGDDDGEIFYDYWLWFFRHARKRAVQQRKEAAD